LWQRQDGVGSSTARIGSVRIEDGSQASLNQRISADKSDLLLQYVGLDLQPADAAVTLKAGGQYNLCVAGHGFSGGLKSVSFSSKFFHVDNHSVNHQDFGDKLDAASVSISVDPETPAGIYTLYGERADGSRAAIVGAVIVVR